MKARASALDLRREALQRRCATQREQLTAAVGAVESRLHSIDRATLAVRKLRLAPIMLAVITTAVAATPLFRNISRGLTIANALGQLLRLPWLESVLGRRQRSQQPQQPPPQSQPP